MAQDEFTEWLQKLHNEADDSVKESVKQVLDNEKVRNYLKSGVMAQSDYTKKTTELAKEKRELESSVERLKTWFQAEGPKNQILLTQLQEKEKELSKVKAKIKSEFLEEEVNPAPSVDPDKFVSKEDYNKLADTLRAFDKNALAFNLDLAKVQKRMIKEGFDREIDDVYAYSAQNRVSLPEAYDALTATDRQKKSEDDFAKRLKEAEEKGARNALSKHNLPDSPGRDIPQVSIFNRESAITDPGKRSQAAIAAFLEAGNK